MRDTEYRVFWEDALVSIWQNLPLNPSEMLLYK